MNQIPLEAVPNQSFRIVLGGLRYELIVKAVGTGVAVSATRSSVLLVSGLRAVAGAPLLPYQYLEAGNFIFVTENDEDPSWEKFGSTHFLVFLTAAEIV